MGVIIEFINFVEGEARLIYRTAPYSELDAIMQIEDMKADMVRRGATHYRLIERDDGQVRETKTL